MCNLDQFKLLNETFGHRTGDEVLKIVAGNFRCALREGDIVARIGGDEFAVVLHEVGDWKDAVIAAQRVLRSFGLPITIQDKQIYVTCSIGISVFPQDGEDLHRLLGSADAACRHAKARGRNNYQFYTEAMNTKATERLELEQQLRSALQNGELDVHYQPQLDLVNGRVCGVEALLRWNNPHLGAVPPCRFIPLAEETGLIVPMGEWALRQACSRNREWMRRGLGPLSVSVNISPRQFQDENLANRVASVLEDTGLDPRRLTLEITESAIMDDLEAALRTLHALRDMGVHLSIDDFGTGYSSLSSLRQFPLSSLKIDRSFIRDVADNSNDREIVIALIALAHNLGLTVVAEGVETREQLALLRARGCDGIQGFYLSRPLPAAGIPAFLTAGFRAVAGEPPRVVDSNRESLLPGRPENAPGRENLRRTGR